jgi:phage gp29-like protein
MKTLYDGSGRPISTDHLQKEVAAPVDFIRQIWTEPVADKLTPAYLAQMIRRARDGDAHEFLTLADDMEEREPHYGSVLRTRKLAVSGLTPQVKPGKKKDARAKEIAEAVEDLIEEPEFGDLVSDLLDSLGKGYSACEIMWETTSNIWKPSEYKHRDPRFFRFDNEDGEKLKLLDKEDSMIGIELPKYKFIVPGFNFEVQE